ncbi:PREDICTED: nucleoporin GLE1 isoform X2 [Dufourea novaeangliae]|uniref:nucleoporin GLE1 isoform X2 n=1 Tax=Dufourea novaeangliae TaxID=178035 RepID=UPI0007678B7B|nr:PREDICTED: nucleoporin GLE1 isoform X2 [Dufourea novaeangliae]
MPHFVDTEDDIMKNINDITSDFTCLKMSALKKAYFTWPNLDGVTIGPDSTVTENESNKAENIENEQNSCNIKSPQKPIHLKNNKVSMQSGITFSVKKILLESEYQRKEEVRRRWQHMKENGKAIKEHMAMSQSHMAEERERKSKENYAYILAEERIAEQEEIWKRHERQREMEEYRKRMKEKEELTKLIMNLRNVFKMKYSDIIAVSDSCEDKISMAILISSYSIKLEQLYHQVEIMDEKIKIGDVTSADLSTIEKAVQQIDEMLCVFNVEIERINAMYRASLANKENSKQFQLQPEVLEIQKPNAIQTVCETIDSQQISTNNVQNNGNTYEDKEHQQNVQIIENMTSSNIPLVTLPVDPEKNHSTNIQNENHLYEYVDKESLQIYVNSKQFLENYMKSYDEFVQSASTKKFRFEYQKAINVPINAISGISKQHLCDKYERLHKLLMGQSSLNVHQHPQGVAFCKNILAKKIVNQGETLVSSKPKMAFPIAAVTIALWNDHSDFGDLLLSHFHNACPYTVPIFLPKMVGQSYEDYYKSMGYKYGEDGTVEKHDKFLKRMSGLMRLYASITITSQRKGINKSNPHGLQNAWRWLAAVLNIEPRREIVDLCATLLLDMLEVAGNALWTAYPNQFHKLLIFLSEEYYPRMQSVGSVGGGPLVRLEEFLKNSLAKGFIPQPDGQLPSNFW